MSHAVDRFAGLLCLSLLACLGCMCGCQTTDAAGGQTHRNTPTTRPNVIVIMTDDQGFGDFGVMGNSVLQTPNLDALARASASVSDFYVSPVCSPTRASLMTGRYNMRTQCIDTFLGRSMMAPQEVTLAEALQDAGYTTGIFGKWHLGDHYPMRPTDQGFETALVHHGGGIGQNSDPRDKPGQYTNPVLYYNNQQINPQGYCTDIYFDAAIDFIREQAAADQPFFTYIATNAPHGPFHDVPEELRADYADKDLTPIMAPGDRNNANAVDRLARIAAMIGNIDQNIGKLIAALESDGLNNNTIIVYLNDNGPNTRRYVRDMRGMKTEIYEGGVRSPLWVRWDGQLKPGHRAELVAAHIDLMPTLLDACGVKPPSDNALDGRSILPALRGQVASMPQRPIVIQAHRGTEPSRYNNFMIRSGPWKLLNSTRPWRVQVETNPTFELYNLTDDPGESNDLASQNPEKLAELRAAYDAWFDDVNQSFKARPFPQRIVIDPARENPSVLSLQDWDISAGWHLEVAKIGTYDILLELAAGKQCEGQGWTAELQIGDTVHTQQMPAGAERVRFEAVTLQPGPTILRGQMRREGARPVGFQYVHISR